MVNTPAPILLDIRGVAAWLSVSVSTARRWAEAGRFPPALKLSEQVHRWRVSDIEAWLASRISTATDASSVNLAS